MTAIIEFYQGDPNDKGCTFDQIISWPDQDLEKVHDYIQWLFPTDEKSFFNLTSPILTKEDIETFRNDEFLKSKVLIAFNRILQFYSFEIKKSEKELQIVCLLPTIPNWLKRFNHNHLRITRILRCLNLVGLKNYAIIFYNTLSENYNLPIETLEFWRSATFDDITLTDYISSTIDTQE